MTDPIPNIPLLRKVVEWVETQAAMPPLHREWYQGSWVSLAENAGRDCVTCYCVAGYVAALDGPVDVNAGTARDGTGISDYAHRALGVTESEAVCLFSARNSAADVREFAERIAERAGDRL